MHFVGYSKDIKVYILLNIHSNGIIVRKDVKFYGNLSAYNPNSMFVSSSLPEYYVINPILFYYFDVGNEDENPPLPTHLLLVDSI